MQSFIKMPRAYFIFLLWMMSCQDQTKEPLQFSAAPHLSKGAQEGWGNADSILITDGIFNPGITAYPWWIKTSFTNPQHQPGLYFLVFNNPHINKLQVYLNGSDSVHFTMGDKFPFRERIYQDRDFVIPLPLDSGESVDVLVLVDKTGETLLLEPQILDENAFWDKRTEENLLVGLLMGWMLIVFLFAIFYSLELKEWSAMFYALYILAVLFWFISHWGLGFQFLWPEKVAWAGMSRPYFNLISNIMLILVILSFFPPKDHGKTIGSILKVILISLSVLLIPASLVREADISITGKMIFLYATFSVSIVMTVLILWYLFIQWQAKVPFAGFYLAGVMFLLCFTVLLQLHQSGVNLGIPYFFFSFGSGFGLMGETSLITIAFAKRAAAYKREKEQLVLDNVVKEKETADRLINVQEEERNRLARDLHDSIGGMLSSIYLQAEKIEKHFSLQETNTLKEMVKHSIQEARSISHNLTPPHLEDLGLEKALENHVQLIAEQHQLKINYHYTIRENIGTPIQVMLYRICSELLHNVVKHAKASEVLVQLVYENHHLEIIVEDDGKGINTKEKNAGIGLKNMRERVNYLKGDIHIDSNEQGTTVLIKIPFKSEMT